MGSYRTFNYNVHRFVEIPSFHNKTHAYIYSPSSRSYMHTSVCLIVITRCVVEFSSLLKFFVLSVLDG